MNTPSQATPAVDVSRERVLYVADLCDGNIYVPMSVGTTLRALLDRAEKAERERDALLLHKAMDNSERAALVSLRSDWATVYQYVMKHAPWTESNDMLAVDELLCGIGLLIQERTGSDTPSEGV